MLGPVSVDEFSAFRQWTPPALRSEIERFTELDAGFVLDGDGTGGHGYHRHGFGIKPDEFPPGWDEYDVVDLVIRIRHEAVTGWRIATVHPYGKVRWTDECQRMGA